MTKLISVQDKNESVSDSQCSHKDLGEDYISPSVFGNELCNTVMTRFSYNNSNLLLSFLEKYKSRNMPVEICCMNYLVDH